VVLKDSSAGPGQRGSEDTLVVIRNKCLLNILNILQSCVTGTVI
jgi:hypothetical protein